MRIDLEKVQNKKVIVIPKEGLYEKFVNLLNKDIKLFGESFGNKKKELFYSELSVLISSGVDFKTALEIIEDEQQKEKDKKLMKKIHLSVVGGKSFSEAIFETDQFSEYEYYSIKIGEESGQIIKVLNELSGYFSKRIKQKRQLINALTYPIVITCTAIGAVVFMITFIVPMFADVFKRFNGDLPALTKIIISASNYLSNYILYYLLVLIFFIFILYKSSHTETYKKISSKLLLKMPIFGELFQKIYLARFCQSMNLLIGSKTPITQSIDLVKKMVGFYPLEKSLEEINQRIIKGESLSKCLSEYPIYTKKLVSLIKVAEEINQMDVMFDKLAKQYMDEVEHQTSIIGTLLEPLIIIFLGALVAIILIAMYLPMFQLSTSFG